MSLTHQIVVNMRYLIMRMNLLMVKMTSVTKGMDDAGDANADINMATSESLRCGDYVKVVSGLFKGFHATVLGKSYGNEV